ncbi:hypothetical protein [Streptomyces sp. NPDC050422]|uniref:hypothetical protein n=1 Tax=Streptomyces sp. NPDC050422 TaxID=3365614 RepID=UPI0037892838
MTPNEISQKDTRQSGTRSIALRVVREMLTRVSADGLMVNGKPHPLLDHLPEMLRAASEYGTYTLEVRKAEDNGIIAPFISTRETESR